MLLRRLSRLTRSLLPLGRCNPLICVGRVAGSPAASGQQHKRGIIGAPALILSPEFGRSGFVLMLVQVPQLNHKTLLLYLEEIRAGEEWMSYHRTQHNTLPRRIVQ